MAAELDIVCLSHLAWDECLFQRPQQLMRQMARRGHRVLYTGCIGWTARRDLIQRGSSADDLAGHDNLRFTNMAYSPWGSLQTIRRAAAASVIRRLMHTATSAQRVVWLYHPGLLPLAERLHPALLVYDIMDRFTAFARSGDDTARMESDLLAKAGIVFTGGRSLQTACESMLGGTSRTAHCFASGLDDEHFARALTPSLAVAPELTFRDGPVLGYIGAVDERIDFDLLAWLCTRRPDWRIVLVGPVLSRPEHLPSNLTLIGARSYSTLPSYLKGFDVCLLPFRQTELVMHISPTKIPEYLAAGRPVVSTPIPDVEAGYADVVPIAGGHAAFLEKCEEMLAHPPAPEALAAQAAGRAQTWTQIAQAMDEILQQTLATAGGTRS